MSLLRIRAVFGGTPVRCQWALVNAGQKPVSGDGTLAQLPRHAKRVQLVLPAAQVLITRARVPPAARRRAGSVLAFAVEEHTVGEPDANHVSWLGAVADSDVLAIVDKSGLTQWRDALGAIGIPRYEVHCETLLLPWQAGEWSLAWNGHEGFVRTGEIEGAATDCGDRAAPPLALRLLIDEAQAHRAAPTAIALYTTTPDAVPDIAAWAGALGIAVRHAGTWDWRTAPPGTGGALAQERQHWRTFAGMAARLRPAAWIVAAALAIHAAALVIDWVSLANEQRDLRQKMEIRFRATFPDAVAVVDPALQMRRKLADARHAAGQSDSGDFLPMLEKVTAGMQRLPAGGLRVLSYESGRITLELAAADAVAVNRVVVGITQSGLRVDQSPVVKRPGGATVVITVRAS